MPYSEPDQDLSPNNDPDWDWGEGGNKDSQDAKEEADKKVEEKKNVLSEAILTGTNNVISEFYRSKLSETELQIQSHYEIEMKPEGTIRYLRKTKTSRFASGDPDCICLRQVCV